MIWLVVLVVCPVLAFGLGIGAMAFERSAEEDQQRRRERDWGEW
jgi:hypothetical protein